MDTCWCCMLCVGAAPLLTLCAVLRLRCLQVVVDSDQTAKALLERGQLTKRVTIIPLNQVCSSSFNWVRPARPALTCACTYGPD
jgi:hypothetical protein